MGHQNFGTGRQISHPEISHSFPFFKVSVGLMNKHEINNRLLLIEDDLADAKLILEALADPQDTPFDVQRVTQLS